MKFDSVMSETMWRIFVNYKSVCISSPLIAIIGLFCFLRRRYSKVEGYEDASIYCQNAFHLQ